jgi:hypothetical protein
MKWFPLLLPGRPAVAAASDKDWGITRDQAGQVVSIQGRPAPSISPEALAAFAFLEADGFQLVGIMALEPWATVQVVRFESPEVRLDLVCVFHTVEVEGPLLTRLVEPGSHLALDEVIPFNLRSGAIDGALERIANWLEASTGDALVGKQSGFEQLERMGARPSKPHNWDEAFRDYAQ